MSLPSVSTSLRRCPSLRWLTLGVVTSATVVGCDEPSVAPAKQDGGAQVAHEKIEASLAAINQYMQSGDWVEAEAIARTLVNKAPLESRAHEMLGQLLIEKAGQFEQAGDAQSAAAIKSQAWECYQRAIELDGSNAGLCHSAGLIAITAGEPAHALDLFLKAEKLDATNAQYPLFAAQLLLQANRLDEAESTLLRAKAIAPHEPFVHASLAMVALERSQFDAAIAQITLAREAEPDNTDFRAQHAKILRRQNEPRKALELLIGLDSASRATEAVTFEIAAAYEALGKLTNAADAWTACCQANTQSSRAYLAAVRAGELFLQAGDRINAARWAGIAQTLNSRAPETMELAEKLNAAGS